MRFIKQSFAFCSLFILFCLLISPAIAAPSWQLQVNTAAENTLHDVCAISDLVAIAVGTDGAVSKTIDRGITWTTSCVTLPAYTWFGVSFPSANIGYIAGTDYNSSHGLIFKTTDGGTTWNPNCETGVAPGFRSIYFATDSIGWAGGQGGYVYYTIDGGSSWSYTTILGVNSISGVHAIYDASLISPIKYHVWIVGPSGKIYYSNDGGGSFTQQTSGVTGNLNDVFFTDKDTGWAVGYGGFGLPGVILKTIDGGTNWSPQTNSVVSNFMGVHFLDSSNGWVVGTGGKIVNTTSGGSTWSEITSPTTSDLNGVHFYDAYNGWAVGGGSRVVAKYGGPTIDLVTDNYGAVGETKSVTITGSNFMSGLGVANVSFGADITINSVTVNSSTQLTVSITIASTAAIGARNVTVTNLDQMAGTGVNAFTVQSATSNPTVTSVSPSFMSQGATGYIVLTGTNFEASMTVAIDGVTVNSVSVTSSTNANVSITVPTLTSAGAKNVTVTTSTGSGILSNGFTVVSATGGPAVSTMTIDWAYQNTASLNTTVVGSGFLSGATVQFSGSGIAVNSTTVRASGTEIDINITVAADAATGRRDVIVNNPDSTVGISANVFEVKSNTSVSGGEKIRSIVGGPSPFISMDPSAVARIHVDVTPNNTFPINLEVPMINSGGRIEALFNRVVTAAGIVNIDFYPNSHQQSLNGSLTGQPLPNGPYVVLAKIGNSVEKKTKYFIVRHKP